MELNQIQAFLAVAEEKHFGRAAERLFLSQPRTSRLVSALEREVGGQLFARTSRKVELTPLGERFRDAVAPACGQLRDALRDAQRQAGGLAGPVRVGCTVTTNGPALSQLLAAFQAAHPDCELIVSEVDMTLPFAALRAGEIDVLVNWLVTDGPDLVAGPVIDRRARMLAVSRSHRLAARPAVSLEDIAGEQLSLMAPPYPREVTDAFCPPATPAGRPLDRKRAVHSASEMLDLVARREIVHLTVDSLALAARPDIVLLPVTDLPPLPLGLIWARAAESQRIRDLAGIARRLGPPRSLLGLTSWQVRAGPGSRGRPRS